MDIWEAYERTKALEHACLNVEETKGILFHSDLGNRYTSEAFESCLKRRETVHSYSRKGYPCSLGFLTRQQMAKQAVLVDTYGINST